VLYFAYGSNMDPDQLAERRINPLSRRHARLAGYALLFNKLATKNPSEGKANITPCVGGIVEGIVYEVVEKELKRLDDKEGIQSGDYLRVKLSVELDDGSHVDAMAYVAHPSKVRSGLKPTKVYLRHLLAGADLLSREYVERLNTTATLG
jgi:gamma-glutamylcyclotransferase